MAPHQKRIRTLHNLLVYLFCLVLFGCTSFTGIQNIRQIDVDDIVAENLTIMTYNIRAGGGRVSPNRSPKYVHAPKKNLLKIAAAIKSVDPDIVGLQEVRGMHQAKFIAEQLNLNFAYLAHGSSNWWGLAVLSKYKIIEIKGGGINVGRHSRVGLMAALDISGKTIEVLNLHYALENYKEQANASMRLIKTAKNPVVLLGDLNRTTGAPELSPIRERFVDTCYEVETKGAEEAIMWGTWWRGMGNRIDLIFIDPKDIAVIDVGLIPAEFRDASDHTAYWTKVKLKD